MAIWLQPPVLWNSDYFCSSSYNEVRTEHCKNATKLSQRTTLASGSSWGHQPIGIVISIPFWFHFLLFLKKVSSYAVLGSLGTCYVHHTSLKLMEVLLFLLLEFWDYRQGPPHPTKSLTVKLLLNIPKPNSIMATWKSNKLVRELKH